MNSVRRNLQFRFAENQGGFISVIGSLLGTPSAPVRPLKRANSPDTVLEVYSGWWVAAQTNAAITTKRTVPQIIPVARTIAVGKVIKGPPFRVTYLTDPHSFWFREPPVKLKSLPPFPHLWTGLWRRARSDPFRAPFEPYTAEQFERRAGSRHIRS